MVMRTLLLAFLFASASARAAVGDFNPVGKYGNTAKEGTPFKLDPVSNWKPEWSEAYFKCADQIPEAKDMFNKISNGSVSDIGPGKPWCPNSDVFKPENTRLFKLASFKELAKYESTPKLDQTAMNVNSPNPPAVGLFQIGPSDVEMYKCKTPDGKPMYTGASYNKAAYRSKANADKDPRVKMLKEGSNNICCALKIAAKQAKKQNVFAEGKKGILGSFWEPARVQKSDGARGEQLRAKVNNICQDIGQNSSYFTAAEREASRKVPAANDNQRRLASVGDAGAAN